MNSPELNEPLEDKKSELIGIALKPENREILLGKFKELKDVLDPAKYDKKDL